MSIWLLTCGIAIRGNKTLVSQPWCVSQPGMNIAEDTILGMHNILFMSLVFNYVTLVYGVHLDLPAMFVKPSDANECK